MKSFIDKTIKPFLVIAGLGTCVSGLLVFSPQFAIENIFKLPFAEDYIIFCQHWSLLVLLVGIFMIISAFRVGRRTPVLIYSAIKKTFLVFLYLSNTSRSFSAGFQGGGLLWMQLSSYTCYYISGRATADLLIPLVFTMIVECRVRWLCLFYCSFQTDLSSKKRTPH